MKKCRPIQYELLFIMRVSLIKCLLLLSASSLVSAGALNGQNILERKVSLHTQDTEIRNILGEIERQATVKFNYGNVIPFKKRVSITVDSTTISSVIQRLFDAKVIAQIVGEEIILKPISENDYDSYLLKSDPQGQNPYNIIIKGIVRDENNQGIPGVSILEKGTTNGTTTEVNGEFSLSIASESSILSISFIGYATQEIIVGAQTQISVILKPDIRSLDEVVIVGFGTQKKETVTGSITSVNTKDLLQSPVANISNSLVGRMPGLFAVQGSGEPGNDASKIRIRGVGTFAGSADPLIMVDGVEVNNYNNIDPNEIESVTVLKDASSTAVYGVRGANGVVLITTKRGKTGAPVLSFTSNVAITSFTNLREGMNSYDYARSFNEALKYDSYISGAVYAPKFSEDAIAKYKSGEDPIFYPDTDWYDLMFKKYSTQTQHNLSLSGGTQGVKYFVSAGYFKQDGLFNNTKDLEQFDANRKFNRYNFRSNFNFDITKRFRARVDLSSQTENSSGAAWPTVRAVEFISRANPLTSPGIVDGKLVDLTGFGTTTNPLASLFQEGYSRKFRNFLQSSVRLDHDLDFITKGLTMHGTVNYQNNNVETQINRRGTTAFTTYNAIRAADGSIIFAPIQLEAPFGFSKTIEKDRRTYLELGFDYKRSFGVHDVTALINYNQTKRFDPTLAYLIPNGYQGVVGRTTYAFKNRYLAEFTFGYNGTENFAPGKRFGFFPAYSLGWVASEEPFFPRNNVLTFLKIRGSYGEVGNDKVGNFNDPNTRFLYRPSAYTITSAAATNYYFGEIGNVGNGLAWAREGRLGNADLTWERAIKQNLGIELAFWSGKIDASVDLFSEKRDNILANLGNVPSTFGATLPAYNLGKMTNRGFEIELGYNEKIGYVNFYVKGNFSYAHNTVDFQDEAPRPVSYQYRTGQRFGQYYGLIADGLYNTWDEVNDLSRPESIWNANRIQPGDIKYRDVNGDGKINQDDQVPIGYSDFPEKIFGITLGANYKGFDFSALFQGAANVSIAYNGRHNRGFSENAGAPKYLLNSWSAERYERGLPIDFPHLSVGADVNKHNYQPSSFWIRDASYLRFKNMEVGYTFTATLVQRIGLTSARLYVNGNNLLTWSDVFPGIDPELPPGIINEEQYPLTRTINLGLNIKL